MLDIKIIATIVYFPVINLKKMRPLLFILVATVLITLAFSCKKKITGAESDLYGTWVKGSHTGDILWFMKKNGQHIIRMPQSTNPQMPLYSEKEYRLNNEALSIKLFAPTSQEYFPISSFTWTDPGKEFTLQNSQLFMFMSSIVTYKYKKI